MRDFLPLLNAAAAHPEFKRDVLEFLNGRLADRVALQGHVPRVKAERVLTQLLHAHPDLAIDRVVLYGQSGCSDFTGELTVFAGDEEHRIAFVWCCAWRAEQEGWKDYFGFWDQARAAREYGWQCFQRWEHQGAVAAA